MTGLTGLIDTLLAAKLSQRLDVLAIKSEVEIAGPGPVIQAQKVDNDTRLLSNAALDRQIAADAPAGSQPAMAPAPAAQLSVAARAIGVLLAEIRADAGPVRDAAPVWPSASTPSAEALASTLARAVSVSGLFYESHLAQFAAGQRTLAQLAQEPQAAWGAPAAASSRPMPTRVEVTTAGTPVRAAPGASPAWPVADGGPGAISGLLSEAADAPASIESAASSPAAARPPGVTEERGAVAPRVAASPSETHAAAGALRADAVRVQATYRQTDAVATGTALDTAALHRLADTAPGAEGVSATSGAARALAPADIIHPQAATIVHQQLDLLATAVFRWSGEAWPGAPMAWSIREDNEDEAAGRHAGATDEAPARRWTTTLSLSLPRLGAVDVRLSLAEPMVQAQVAASDPGTLADLRVEGRALARRLETIGLRLQDLQITGMPRP
ncbi:flagellar hook-length control protein FliK [Variovorax sp. PBL-E5]|uniref:flagellar hook-length control protein FliK n=1 Tax=Variovorax sp. PBL-E5 TaxID=434014 RepID=UPI001316ABFE|nr:flagellar hook-length control protein FliK [Variovorax sp. PBL-E5]VTU33320.1 Flagellar hook-length control protein FliK [Variovorax sp. PBL-E5]